MKYLVTILTTGNNPELVINESKFEQLKKAKECLSEILSFEEKYELLLSNYMELEKECLLISAQNMVYEDNEYMNFFDIKLLFNQRIVNLLTTSRLYIDQLSQHIKACNLDIDIKSFFSYEYDNNFEYRFMEALRNYVQHRGLAVHFTSIGTNWTSLDDDGEMQFKTRVYTKKDEVEKDSAFKKSVAKEMPDKVDIIYASRSYIESISKVHCNIRKILSDVAISSRQIVEEIIHEYEKTSNGKSIGLGIVCLENNGKYDEILDKFYITLEWDNIRIKLERKNQSLVNLRKRFVSSSIKQDK
jgi:hypothetical protein